MFVIGIASAALMYLFAPLLAGISPIANVNNGILAIRSLCPSLIAIPILSAMRGYFKEKMIAALWNFFDYRTGCASDRYLGWYLLLARID